MKRIAIAALAALTLTGPLAATAAYADPPGRYDNRGEDSRRGDDRRDDSRASDDRRDSGWREDERRGDGWRGDERRDDRGDRRRDRRHGRWNDQSHNGYSYNGRWNYGPPPEAYYGRQGFEPGYRAWRRGDRLPSYYQSRYRQVDYRREHLRAPPRGYRYVEDDRGDTLLVGIATGVILGVILSNY
jgi:Ni/Co efflux regulator RcnB